MARTRVSLSGWCVVFAAVIMLTRLGLRNASTMIAVLLFALLLGWWRGAVFLNELQPYQTLARQSVTFTGVATIDAVYGKNAQLSFSVSSIHFTSPYDRTVPGTIKMSGFGAHMVYRGDVLQISGKLYPTRGAAQASIGYAQFEVVGSRPSFVDGARRKFTAGMQSALPEPLASFGLGLLVGQRNTLPTEVSQALLMVGLTHIIAVSGYNLTILLEASRRLLGNRSKFQSTFVALALIGLFLLFAGSSASIVRAAVISIIGLAAWYYGRTVRPLLLIMLAAALTAYASPIYFWSDISWYLSFLAFFGVLVLAPLVARRLLGKKQPSLMVQIMIESMCAQIMTIPIVLYIFGQVSLIGLPANMLVVALIPLAMLLSLIAGIAGMIIPAVAGWLAWPAQILLTYMLDVAHILSRVPHVFVQNVSLSIFGMSLLYGTVLFALLVLHSRNKAKTGKLTDEVRNF